jgi:hypothetical protein
MKTLNPNDFGKSFLVEECQKVRIEDFLKTCRIELKKLVLNLQIEALGQKIGLATSKTCFDGVRFWFSCPICSKKAGVLFTHPITSKVGCRTCLGLDYRKRRYKGMIEGNEY